MKFDEAFEYTKGIVGSFQWLSCRELYRHASKCTGVMVEVGVDQGRSASLMLAAATTTGARVILIDSWESVLIDNKAKVERMVADFPEVNTTIIHARSEVASQLVSGFDLIHIDANHYEDNPDIDCRSWLPKLRNCGVAMFHDYGSCFPSVTKAVDTYTAGWEDLGVWEGLAIRRKPC